MSASVERCLYIAASVANSWEGRANCNDVQSIGRSNVSLIRYTILFRPVIDSWAAINFSFHGQKILIYLLYKHAPAFFVMKTNAVKAQDQSPGKAYKALPKSSSWTAMRSHCFEIVRCGGPAHPPSLFITTIENFQFWKAWIYWQKIVYSFNWSIGPWPSFGQIRSAMVMGGKDETWDPHCELLSAWYSPP